MRKTDKKMDNQLRDMLTKVCDDAIDRVEGFQWLTHQVNYSNFPYSLKVTCVFERAEQVESFLSTTDNTLFVDAISKGLDSLKVKVKNVDKIVAYDSEEACSLENGGNWARRLG